MALTIQDDMIEAAQLLTEEEQKDFYFALIRYSTDGSEPDYSDLKAWHVAFKTCKGRIELSNKMRELSKKANATRWDKTPDNFGSIPTTATSGQSRSQQLGTIPQPDGRDMRPGYASGSVLRRDENRREEMSTGEKRLGGEREEEKEKEKIKKKKNEKETREESGEGVSDGNVAGASPTERLVQAWTFGGRGESWR